MIDRMVLFGVSGDPTSRPLLPVVAQLAEAELLPPGLTIVGSDLADWSADEVRGHIAGKPEEHATVTPATRDVGRKRQVGDFPQAFSHLTLTVAARESSEAEAAAR